MSCKRLGVVPCCFVLFGLGCSGGGTAMRGGGGGSPDDPVAERGVTAEQMEEIQRVERNGRPALIDCYTDELERLNTKKLKGKVTVKIYIGADGRVLQVAIAETTLRAPRVHTCIQNAVKGWEFPRLRSPTWYGTTLFFDPAY